MSDRILPVEFSSLDPFAAWCLRTETERNNKRLASTFADISAFADAILPQVEAITAYIDARQAEGELSDEGLRLYYMLLFARGGCSGNRGLRSTGCGHRRLRIGSFHPR
jgi:hypothetical protein